MEKNILSHYAAKHTSFLHGHGQAGTEHLFSKLDFSGGKRVLEIGFGTGGSLIKLKSHFPTVQLFGIERNEFMYKKAQQRLRYSLITGVDLSLAEAPPYSFPDHSFDIIYIESVLAILSLDQIKTILKETARLLKPGGSLALNETLWLPATSPGEIEQINNRCLEHYGIIQANGECPYAADWKSLIEQYAYQVAYLEKASSLAPVSKKSWQEWLSKLYSTLGRFKMIWNPQQQQQEQEIIQVQQQLFEPGRKYMESYILIANRL